MNNNWSKAILIYKYRLKKKDVAIHTHIQTYLYDALRYKIKKKKKLNALNVPEIKSKIYMNIGKLCIQVKLNINKIICD